MQAHVVQPMRVRQQWKLPDNICRTRSDLSCPRTSRRERRSECQESKHDKFKTEIFLCCVKLHATTNHDHITCTERSRSQSNLNRHEKCHAPSPCLNCKCHWFYCFVPYQSSTDVQQHRSEGDVGPGVLRRLLLQPASLLRQLRHEVPRPVHRHDHRAPRVCAQVQRSALLRYLPECLIHPVSLRHSSRLAADIKL